METPLISVIIPCYNQANFLQEACNSLINQSYTNWDAYIINDGSVDETETIAKKICSLDNRFNYHYQQNKGLSATRNLGLNKCKGDFIQFLDSDDKITNTKFHESIELYNVMSSELIISNFLRFKSKNGREKRPHFHLKDHQISFKSVLLHWDIKFAIPIHCALFSSKTIGNIRFNESLKAKEDWVFWLDVLKNTPSISFYNKKHALYRAHKKNMSRNINLMHQNCEIAYNVIYNELSNEDKKLFFKRINSELTESRTKYSSFKDQLFSRKFIRFLKK